MLLVRTPLGYDYMQIGEQTIFQKKVHRNIVRLALKIISC